MEKQTNNPKEEEREEERKRTERGMKKEEWRKKKDKGRREQKGGGKALLLLGRKPSRWFTARPAYGDELVKFGQATIHAPNHLFLNFEVNYHVK